MRANLVTTTALIAGSLGLFGQGLVKFDNSPYLFNDSVEVGGNVDYKVYRAPGEPVDDANWMAQLWEQVDGSFEPVGLAVAFYGSVFPGVWAADVDDAAGYRQLSVPNGTTTVLEVRIYDGNNQFLGRSDGFAFTPSSMQPPDEMFMKNFRGFVVPEPSAVALGILSLVAYCVSYLQTNRAPKPNQSPHPTPRVRLGSNRTVKTRAAASRASKAT